MRFILSYIKKYKWFIAFGVFLKLLGAFGELMLPYVLEHLIDDVVPTENMTAVILWGLGMMGLAFMVRQLNVWANHRAAKVARDGTYEIRRDLFWKTLQLSGNQVDEFALPSLISRMTSDSYNVQNFIQSVQAMGVRAPILLFGGIVVTLTMDPGLAFILCIMAPILIVLVVFISFKGIPLYERVQQRMDNIVRIMRENITGIRVVKSLSKETFEKNRFERANEQMFKADMQAGTVMAMPGPIMTLFLNVGLTLVVFFGAKRVDAGLIEPGVILAFLTYFNMIMMGVMGLNRIFMMMSKANASAKRIQAVVDAPDVLQPIAIEQAAHFDLSKYSGQEHIVFEHVHFSYNAGIDEGDNEVKEDREMCLSDIHFSMKRGESLGIIGATGSGKTTIINLLMRFYEADAGHIFINGRDVRTYDKETLHRMFGVVFQNDVIFADSLRNNISFGREVTEAQIRAAAADAKAAEFIENYEDGYDHKAVIHGGNLSGGQKQRVLISRALVANPEILILDDSSSALDYKTDAALRKAIREQHNRATTIIIAQRISSIMSLDKIIVLDDGKMIGYGAHEELMKDCSMYRDIYQTQMGEYVNG